MPRVDLLGDEDELRHQKKSKSPSVKCHAPGALVDAGALVERLADEAQLLVRRREACPERARAAAPARRREQDERVRASLHLVDRSRDERPDRGRPSGAATRSARNPAETPCLNVCPTTRDADELAPAIRPEAAVVARRVEVAPVEVLGVAGEVAAVAGGSARAERVQSRRRSGRPAAPRARGSCAPRVGGAHPAVLPRAPEHVADDAADPQRPSPQPQPREVDPAEPADEDRVRLGVREGHGERRARGGRRLLVLLLQRREHALAAVARVRRDVHRDREPRLDALRACVLKKLIAATPTTSPSSTASETIPSPAGLRSNHHANSSSESCVVPTRASSATSDGRHSGV